MQANASELDDLKAAWQSLDRQLQRDNALRSQDLRERRLDRARGHLRPLQFGMALQALLGIGLVVLGVACWTNNTDVAGLLATGIILHAAGVAHVVFAGLVVGLAAMIDYGAPVLAIQKRLRLLLRLQVLNSNLCGLPWWILWVLVVVGFAGLDPQRAAGATPAWIWINLGIGVAGLLGTWAWSLRKARKPRDPHAFVDDGADGIRRSLRMLGDLDEFERG